MVRRNAVHASEELRNANSLGIRNASRFRQDRACRLDRDCFSRVDPHQRTTDATRLFPTGKLLREMRNTRPSSERILYLEFLTEPTNYETRLCCRDRRYSIIAFDTRMLLYETTPGRLYIFATRECICTRIEVLHALTYIYISDMYVYTYIHTYTRARTHIHTRYFILYTSLYKTINALLQREELHNVFFNIHYHYYIASLMFYFFFFFVFMYILIRLQIQIVTREREIDLTVGILWT